MKRPRLNHKLLLIYCKDFGVSSAERARKPNGCSVEEDTPFVLGVNVEVDDGDKHDLKIVISMKRLLRLMIKTEGVQTDATYKLIWQGYPVLIVGSSDMNRTFHPFAIAVCSNETESDFAFIFNCVKDSCYKINETEWNPKLLLADASSAITNGFKAVFGFPFRRLMCYFHVVKNIDGKLRGIQDKDEIILDVFIYAPITRPST
ncbi:hypothetical protein AVEN_13845-1 [Araneus ventricosus]|uniref:MULE transposase domain-containing protein n=1 Tax=Araneus ventricosus TaxID=182803 RepID=A0A4Y2LGV6_ARAVE|nr:hypothetical protein AVEN_13845-1 [Araneus ventricosus]